jgi:hypothetical protein
LPRNALFFSHILPLLSSTVFFVALGLMVPSADVSSADLEDIMDIWSDWDDVGHSDDHFEATIEGTTCKVYLPGNGDCPDCGCSLKCSTLFDESVLKRHTGSLRKMTAAEKRFFALQRMTGASLLPRTYQDPHEVN